MRNYRDVDLDPMELAMLTNFLENMIEQKVIDSPIGVANTKGIIEKLKRQAEIAENEF